MWLKNARPFLADTLTGTGSGILGTKGTFDLWNNDEISPRLASGERFSDIARSDGSSYVTFGKINLYANMRAIYQGSALTSYTTSQSTAEGVVFGTGTSAPTEDDYSLSGNLIAGLSTNNVTTTSSFDVDVDGCTYTCVYTISNTTGSDITIGEIGICSYMNGKFAVSTSNRYIPVLIERTVLDSPVSIPAGGVGQVTYTIRIEL